ncbi:hypothetical protein [Amorphus sp. 3PC139-8]|uniref:hypothetical protein n=1 Tax=Amorphus sp. 3PC139-8 TaxID=2735676 RepID=UPI00345D87D8
MPNALIMFVSAANRDTANAALENVGLGPNNISTPYALAVAPTVATHYASHWGSISAEQQALMATMLSGVMPTEYLDEFGRPAEATWDNPTASEASAAMLSIVSDMVTYPDINAYSAQVQMVALAEGQGLVAIEPDQMT